MKMTTLTVLALVGDRARRALAPTPGAVLGAAVSIDGSPSAHGSAPLGIPMV